MRTLGIDLSANPAKTGACEVDWDTGAVTFLERPTSDEHLVEAAQRADLTAIDVPLGWPDGFIDAIVAHRDRTGWPPIGTAPPEDRIPLRYRTTDLLQRTGGSQPLSVSSDLIGVAAMRGARIQHLLEMAGVPVDRSGVTGRVIEAYPAAALRAWGLSSSKYKGTPNAQACRILAGELTGRCGPLSAAAAACLDGCDDDGLDGFVCALVARAALAGNTTRPGPEHLEVARREGWIHIPTVALESINSPAPVRAVTEPPPERRRPTARPAHTDSPLDGADDTPLEVVTVDTRSWGEQGGSYSPDRLYRWCYERPIGSGPPICWIGLNPGTGDREGRYRTTLQRMVDRSVQLGMGRFILVNLFSWRATDPRDLRAAAAAGHDIIGSDTDQVIADAARRADVVVAAWGHHGTLLGREQQVIDTIPDLKCVGLTAKGHPRHPLYVPAAQPLVPLH